MNYKLLGRSGLRVSELCLGTMTFGEEWGWGASKEESRKMFDTFLEAGGNFLDTANRYTDGTSEKLLGEFIQAERERIVLATKFTLQMNMGDPNAAGNHRKNMMQALDNSLKRLNTDYVDLYWLHAWDYLTPVEEVMRALDDMIRAGKVMYIGISDTPAWIVSRANTMAELLGWTQFVALQVEHSLLERTVERELLPMAREYEMAITPWGAIGGGVLTGKYNKGADDSGPRRYNPDDPITRVSERNLAIAEEVVKIAGEIGRTPAQVAYNWVRQQPGNVIPILGTRTNDQLKDNLASLEWEMSEEQLKTLDEASKIDLGFPHEFLKKDFIRDLLYAGTYDKIDSSRS